MGFESITIEKKTPQVMEKKTISAYEGNPSLVMFKRFSNPVIREQMINLFLQIEEEKAKQKDIEIVYDDYGNPILDEQGRPKIKKTPSSYVPKSRKSIELRTEMQINKVKSETPITFSPDVTSFASMEDLGRETIALCSGMEPGKKPTLKQQEIIESHEKGHAVRKYTGPFLERYFAKGFDPRAIDYTAEDFEKKKILAEALKLDTTGVTYDMAKESLTEYLFSGPEIAERMSQLKNYFGFTGNEQFTKEHLHYAKENYIKDTQMDNDMKHFFQAITHETEDAFIELINNSGI